MFHNAGQEITYDATLYHFQAAYAAVKDSSKFKDSKFSDADGDSRVPDWHDLRRKFARHARRAGGADSEIMNISGWKTHAMLLRYLGEAKADAQRSAFARME
jgi:hypothetical protein